MPEMLDDELLTLAAQAEAGPAVVVDLCADIAKLYIRESMQATGGAETIDEGHPALPAVRERVRERLQGLLAWARQSGRM